MKTIPTVALLLVVAMVGCESSGETTDPGSTPDHGVQDLGTPDQGVMDTNTEDRGAEDMTGGTDQGPTDLGSSDLGTEDQGPTDPGTTDLGPLDQGTIDPGTTDLGPADPGPQPPAGHTENNGGYFHTPGKDDPPTQCVSCHGSTLRGDLGPSCHDCHNNDPSAVAYINHTSRRGGQMHRSGGSSTCKACHGPNNNGGLGPACSTCH